MGVFPLGGAVVLMHARTRCLAACVVEACTYCRECNLRNVGNICNVRMSPNACIVNNVRNICNVFPVLISRHKHVL